MQNVSCKRRGFSLVELSIVLVVIAIIAGGAMAGRSLINAAKIRSLLADINIDRTAVETFKQQYSAYPGDLANAFDFFGSDCGTDSAAPSGCNGDGNGSIHGTNEGYRAWQHLALAGNIKNLYNGVVGAGCTPGVNVPESKLGMNAGLGFESNTSSAYLPGRPSFVNLLFVGANSSDTCTGAAITVFEAKQIDLKTDDGNPTSGELVGVGGSCVSGSDFDYSQSGTVCAIAFTLN